MLKTTLGNDISLDSQAETTGNETEDITPSKETQGPPVLIIHGASSTKIGFGGERYPRFVYPMQSNDLSQRIRKFPIDGSNITDKELLIAYWEAIFKKLKIDITNNRVLLSLPTANLMKCPFGDFVQDYFIQEFNASEIAIISDPFLALIGYVSYLKELTGLIVDIGFSQIRIVPIFKSAILENHIAQFSFGGYFFTQQLGLWLQKQGYDGPVDALFIRDIKEKFCEVRGFKQAPVEQDKSFFNHTFGKYDFILGSERWKLPELLFYKGFFASKVDFCPRSEFEGEKFNMKEITLSKAIGFVIRSLYSNLQKDMFNNIFLTGGGAKFIGLQERISDELKHLYPEYSKNIRVLKEENTDLIPFKGASKLSILNSFQDYWRTLEDYESGVYRVFL